MPSCIVKLAVAFVCVLPVAFLVRDFTAAC